jgi:hypothetical protein
MAAVFSKDVGGSYGEYRGSPGIGMVHAGEPQRICRPSPTARAIPQERIAFPSQCESPSDGRDRPMPELPLPITSSGLALKPDKLAREERLPCI